MLQKLHMKIVICMTNLYYENAKFETFPNLESPSNLGVEENVRI